jgi:hypothetical protein
VDSLFDAIWESLIERLCAGIIANSQCQGVVVPNQSNIGLVGFIVTTMHRDVLQKPAGISAFELEPFVCSLFTIRSKLHGPCCERAGCRPANRGQKPEPGNSEVAQRRQAQNVMEELEIHARPALARHTHRLFWIPLHSWWQPKVATLRSRTQVPGLPGAGGTRHLARAPLISFARTRGGVDA